MPLIPPETPGFVNCAMCSSTSSFTTGVTLFITSNIDPPSGLDAPPLSPPHTTLCIITVHSSSMPSIPSGTRTAPSAALLFSLGGVKRLHRLFRSDDGPVAELLAPRVELAPESRRPAELTLLRGAPSTSVSDGLGGSLPEDAVDDMADMADIVDTVGGCYSNRTTRRTSRSALTTRGARRLQRPNRNLVRVLDCVVKCCQQSVVKPLLDSSLRVTWSVVSLNNAS
mmetsp:Transcript_17472/g.45451  ORF Transcript_17472/g.45451 Transcript_17472/m.45451 type:complete len:226 (-) Transcript_17472:140-817(-)